MTITQPVDPSIKKLKYAPTMQEKTPIDELIVKMTPNLSLNRYAVAPGVTTSAITRNAPTVCRAATVQALNMVKNIIFVLFGFNPIVTA